MDLDRRQLLERVREQEGVIRNLWDRYTEDIGHEPDIGEVAAPARGPPARAEAIRTVLNREQTFDDAVDLFELKRTHCYAEASAQRVAVGLMHSKRPAVVARKAGDVIVKGFWGKGVSMPGFEKLLQKLRGFKHGSFRRIDFSDNGLNGNFVPGIIDILRRGAHQLDLSNNSIESAAMQQLCNALPNVAQYLDVLDLRFNPCASDPNFVFCLAGILPDMRFMERLAVTIRQDQLPPEPSTRHGHAVEPQHGAPPPSRAWSASLRAPADTKLRRAATPAGSRRSTPSGVARAAAPSRGRPASADPHSWRVRSVSQSHIAEDSSRPAEPRPLPDASRRGSLLGKDAAVALFRATSQCPQLRSLDLRSSSLSRQAVQRLAQFVRGDQLTTLSLADCFLGEAAEPILEAVGECHRLVYLNLRMNCLKGATGHLLHRALDSSVSLTEVDLASNELGDDFGEMLAGVVASNESLWKLDLIRNPLRERTGHALLKALQRRNSTLVSIGDMDDNFDGLGLRNRYRIQCHLDANRQGYQLGEGRSHELGERPDAMSPDLSAFEWKIIDQPPFSEPMWALI